MPENIADDDRLYRRIAPEQILPDGTITSVVFKSQGKPDPCVSVDLARLTTPEATIARGRKPWFGVGVLVAGYPRSIDLAVRHDPQPDNEAHSLIEGLRRNDKMKCRLLAQNTTLVIWPGQPARQ